MATNTKRRANSNTATAAIAAAKAVAEPIPSPPAHVRTLPCHLPFWEDIIASRARTEWSKTDYVIAAQLARCQYDIETHTDLLNGEGHIIENQRGTPIMNPRHTILEQLARRQMAMMRSLAMGGALPGKGRADLDTARKLERGAAQARNEIQDDDFLAT